MIHDPIVQVDTGICPFCREPGTLQVPVSVLQKWNNGRGQFIQQAWPEGTPDQREQLMTGIHGKCFDEAIPEEE